MTRILIGATVALLAGAAVSAVVVAQDLPEVSVQASRAISTKTVGTTASGVPIQDVSLSYGVSTKGLDLSSYAGAMELKKRVTDAATAACKEISRQYPASTTTEDAECARAATDKAMVKVNELIAAAAKKPAN
jgi:UrcA family protein